MRVVITGHRPKKLPGGYDWNHPRNVLIMQWMAKQLEILDNACLVEGDTLTACTGMALGVDQMFARVCCEARIPFIAFIPCLGQENPWPQHSQNLYHHLLRKAAFVTYVTECCFTSSCMQMRNNAMRDWALVSGSPAVPVLIAVWDGGSGGTANMVKGCKDLLNLVRYNPASDKEVP